MSECGTDHDNPLSIEKHYLREKMCECNVNFMHKDKYFKYRILQKRFKYGEQIIGGHLRKGLNMVNKLLRAISLLP